MDRPDAPLDVLAVGPVGYRTGGIAQYARTQAERLDGTVAPDGRQVSVRLYDTTPGGASGLRAKVLATLFAWLRFPFRRRPDLVHVHTSQDLSFLRNAWYVLVAAWLWRRPVVLHVHGPSFDEYVASATGPTRLLQRVVFAAADRVVVLSAYWREALSARVAPEKLVVVPNAVVADAFDPEYGADPPRVVLVANQVPRKGIEAFVAAVDRLAERGDRFAVDIAGAGPLAGRSAALAARHDRVTYHGYVGEAEKRRLLNEGSVFVLASRSEALPLGLLEGMAGGNVPEVVSEAEGVVVPVDDVPALVDALASLVADPARLEAMGRRSRATVEREYDWTVAAARLAALYAEVTTPGAATARDDAVPTTEESESG
jgi:glycosyltransferase involved in cell wall biosynthesis